MAIDKLHLAAVTTLIELIRLLPWPSLGRRVAALTTMSAALVHAAPANGLGWMKLLGPWRADGIKGAGILTGDPASSWNIIHQVVRYTRQQQTTPGPD